MNMMSPALRATVDACVRQDEDVVVRMGEMLWSAIRHGGLLNEKLWPVWVSGVQDAISISSTLVAIDLRGAASSDLDAAPRRWIADPITGLLIVRWHRDASSVPESLSVDDCLRAYRGIDVPSVVATVRAYRDDCEFRMPGLMLAYAKGDIPGASVPQSTWQRLIYGNHDPVVDQLSAEPAPPTTFKPRDWTRLEEAMRPELFILARRPPRYAAGRKAVVQHKSGARKAITALPPAAGIHGELRSWCSFALARERAGRVSIGYAPSTTRAYLRALAGIFSEWTHDALNGASSEMLEPYVHRRLRQLDAPARAGAAKAMLSLQRYLNLGRGQDALDINLSEYLAGTAVSPNLVPPDAYARALAGFERRGDDDFALILTLMFRAGLRLEEAVALRVGDVCAAGQHLELVVEENDERALKTKTSRRIIPLDVLLEAHERRKLIEHADARRDNALGVEAWLFGPELATSPSRLKPIREQIDRELRRASGLAALNHGHLRHSFASFLLATLMLPQDMAAPPIPERLLPVISPARFARVADRLLGRGRLGAGALHAVAQLMGHTGPRTALRYYCHLLDLSLGLYCSRPSTLPACDTGWLGDQLGIGIDARRKAAGRAAAGIGAGVASEADNHCRPDAREIMQHTPGADRKLADARMIEVGTKRLARPIASALSTAIDEARRLQREQAAIAQKIEPVGVDPVAKRACRPHLVPWRSQMADLNGGYRCDMPAGDGRVLAALPEEMIDLLRAAAPTAPEFARFVDQRLSLSRRPRTAERAVVAAVVARWQRGATDIRIKRLGDGVSFVELLGVMGFARKEIALSVTGAGGRSLSSTVIHRFLTDRSVAPHLAGRTGWRGSLVVRLQPAGLGMPILAARVCRFALMMLALDAQRISDTVAGERGRESGGQHKAETVGWQMGKLSVTRRDSSGSRTEQAHDIV